MSTSRFHSTPRRSFLAGTSVAPLLSLIAAALLSTPSSSSADCCGGSASSFSGSGGLPPIESFGGNSRLKLRIFPGQRNQKMEIFNMQTGVRIATVPFGGSSGLTPFGVTAPDTGGAPVTYTISDVTNQESGSMALASFSSGGGDGGSGGEGGGGGKCPECDPPYSGTSVEPAAEQPPTPGCKNCKKAGEGDPKDTTSNAPDDSESGEYQEPINPEPPDPTLPPTSGETTGTTVPAPAPGLFDALIANLKGTKGGADIPISLGEQSPELEFSARHIQSLDLSSPNFSRHFRTEGFSKTATTVTQVGSYRKYDPDNNKYEAYAGSDGLRPIGNGEYVGNGFRSISSDKYAGNLVKVDANTWEIRLIKLGDRIDIPEDQIITAIHPLVSADGYVQILYDLSGGGFAFPVPRIIWRFSTTMEGGRKILNIKKIDRYPIDKGFNEPRETVNVRYWQEDDLDGTRYTYMENLNSAGVPVSTTKVIDRDDGANFVRGRITYEGTGADATHEGWIMQTGPDYQGQPTAGSDPNVTVVNFGGSGNTIWQWATNGMWEKKTITPSVDAISRRVTTLRPWGTATTPLNATESNAHCTVEEINELKVGEVRTTIVSMGGQEVSRIVDARGVAASSGGNIFNITDTHVAYPAGPQSAPTVSYSQRFSTGILHPGAGRVNFRSNADGSTESITYYAGYLTIPTLNDPDPTAEWTFTEAALGAERLIQRDFQYLDGRKERKVEWEDEEGRLRMTHRYALVSDTPYFIESVRRNYRGTQLILVERSRVEQPDAADWIKEYEVQGTLQVPNIAVHTDEAGVTTTEAFTSFETDYPSTITRAAIPAANGLPAVPEQVIALSYDSAYRVTSTKVKQGATILEQVDRTYSDNGELKSITLNDAIVTEFRSEDYGLGGKRLRKYRRAKAEASPGTLVSEAILDWRGKLISRTGSETVELHQSEIAVGPGRIQLTAALGPAANPLVTLVKERDGLGRRTGQKASVPNGQWRTWAYDVLGRLTTEKINNETVRSWNHGSEGLTTQTITPGLDPQQTVERQRSYIVDGGAVWDSEVEWQYKLQSKVTVTETQTKISGFAGPNELAVTRTRSYGGDWGTTTITADPGAKTITETIAHSSGGDPTTIKYRAGLVAYRQAHGSVSPTIYTHDALGRITNVSANNGRQTTVVGYDPILGDISSAVTTGLDGSTTSQTNVYYQPNESSPGLLKSQTVDGRTTYYKWTARGELEAIWGATAPVKYDYDSAGRRWKMHTYRSEPGNDPAAWPVGDVTEWVYYPGTLALQVKKDAANFGTVYEYDPRGWVSKRTRARTYNGGALFTTYTRNRLGELKSIDHNDATPDVTLTRDSLGHVVSVTDGAGGWTFAYDAQDELEREVNIASGNALILQRDPGGRRLGYSYWDQGAGKWVTWGGYGYDPATARLTGVSTPEGWISQGYAPNTSNPNSVSFGQIQSTRTYDDLDRVINATTLSNIVGGDPSTERIYAYDANGLRQSMEDENGDVWEYSYNGRNEVTGAVKKRGAATLPGRQHAYTFDAIGNRTQWGLNPSPSSRQYNSRNQASSGSNSNYFTVTGKADASPTTALTLNGQAITNRNGMDFAASITAGNPYQPVWQSVNVTETKQGQAPTQTTGHVFQPRTTANVAYDADGNLIGDDRWNYTWDAENRLIKQETSWQGSGAVAGMPILRIEYKYDAYGRRTEKKISTWSGSSFQLTRVSKFAYDGWNLIAEWDSPAGQPASLSLARTHHWGLDVSGSLGGTGGVGALVLSRYHQANGQTTSCVPAYDGNGNVIALYDNASGKRAAEYEYGPFGELLRSTGSLSSANPFRFSTKYQDDQTGLLYYGYRYYLAETGRWIGRDPIGEAGGINLYGMVRNNPVNAVDALGLETVEVTVHHYFWDSRYQGDENDPNRATGEGWSVTKHTVTLPDKAKLTDIGWAALNGAKEELGRQWQSTKAECECLLDSFRKFLNAWNTLELPSMEEIVSFAKDAVVDYVADQVATIHQAIYEGKSIYYQNDKKKAASAAGAYITKEVVKFVKARVGGPLLKTAKKKFESCLKPAGGGKKYHGNDRRNSDPQHNYDILNKDGRVRKNGVGTGLAEDGVSKRAESQLEEGDTYRITDRHEEGDGARGRAYDREKERSLEHYEAVEPMDRHKRPKP